MTRRDAVTMSMRERRVGGSFLRIEEEEEEDNQKKRGHGHGHGHGHG
ncbi:hypothetical protein HZ326_5031, partial [Fusarium oxysporum f. sp. albedinis]